jgi:hypothetical protein
MSLPEYSNTIIKVANKSFENVEKYRCMGSTLKYKHYIREEIKIRLNFGNLFFHRFQNHSKKEEVMRGWTKLLKEIHRLYCSRNSIKVSK